MDWPLRRRDVERNRALVAVDADEIGALGGAGHHRRRETAGVVAGAGTLDLDHLGAEIAEHLGAGRAGEHAGQVQHPQALQRTGGILWRHGVALPVDLAGICRNVHIPDRPAPDGVAKNAGIRAPPRKGNPMLDMPTAAATPRGADAGPAEAGDRPVRPAFDRRAAGDGRSGQDLRRGQSGHRAGGGARRRGRCRRRRCRCAGCRTGADRLGEAAGPQTRCTGGAVRRRHPQPCRGTGTADRAGDRQGAAHREPGGGEQCRRHIGVLRRPWRRAEGGKRPVRAGGAERDRARAAWRGRRDHPVERADAADGAEDRACPGRGKHGGGEVGGGGAAGGAAHLRDHEPGAAAGMLQHAVRLRPRIAAAR